MKLITRSLAALLALVLLVGCTLAGLALPVSAASDTFKLAKEDLYLAPTDAGGYIVYNHVQALNPDGTPYEGTLTWSSSNNSVAAVNATTGRIATVSSNKGGIIGGAAAFAVLGAVLVFLGVRKPKHSTKAKEA